MSPLKRWLLWIGIAACCSAVAVGVAWLQLKSQRARAAEAEPAVEYVPEFSFPSHNGSEITLEMLRGKYWIADFFFTSCPGICPTMSANMRQVQKAFSGDSRVKLVSFTVDPKRDTAERLKAYAKKMGADDAQWFFATGDKERIYTFAMDAFHLATTKGGTTGIIHSDRFMLVGPDGRVLSSYHGTDWPDVERLIADLKKLLGPGG